MQNIPTKVSADELGYMQLTKDGAVLSSRGCLQNAEDVAKVMMNVVTCALNENIWGSDVQQVQRITITCPEFAFVVCLANQRLHILKKSLAEPMLDLSS